MADEGGPIKDSANSDLPSMEQVARLDAYLDGLIGDQRPVPRDLSTRETREYQLAAQLRLARETAEAPTPAFLKNLEQRVDQAIAGESHRMRRSGLSRGRFLRSAAMVAGGAGLGVAGVEGAAMVQEMGRPHDLVVPGNERWYPVAAEGEVAPGGAKAFSAGGVLGYLLNTDGRLHAVSAICTHMGCRVKPDTAPRGTGELRCLCHDSRFKRTGEVVQGRAPSPLPSIALRVENGQVYALGTRETV